MNCHEPSIENNQLGIYYTAFNAFKTFYYFHLTQEKIFSALSMNNKHVLILLTVFSLFVSFIFSREIIFLLSTIYGTNISRLRRSIV